MNEKTLFERQQSVKAEFDALSARKSQKDTEVEEMNTETLRLQGEWRMLDKLRQEIREGKVDPATTIVAEPEPPKAPTKAKK